MNATQNLILDFRRLLLLAGKVLKFGLFPFAATLPIPFYRRMSFAVRLRRAIEELGLTYLKLGQFLALRYDVLPPEICTELNKLFENVRPMSFDKARARVEAELGDTLERLFSRFEPEPIAAASVAQVHRAFTASGQQVAVKVQREGLEPIFRADIRILRRFAAIAQRLGLAGRLSVKGMVIQFEQWTLREMDFEIEARTTERVASRAQDFVVIPKVYWRLTTRRVLTMEFIEGVSVTEVRAWVDSRDWKSIRNRLPGFKLETALHNLAFASFHQLFSTGFFHGDPHPGNIFFLPNNQVAFLDFGIFGSLDHDEREIVAAQIENLALGDLEASFRSYARQVAMTDETDYRGFRRDCLEVLGRWYAALTDPKATIEDRHLAKYTAEMIDVSRRNGLRYDLNYLLFWRALNNLNGTLWRIDPSYDLVKALREFFEGIRPSELDRIRAVVCNPDWQNSVKSLTARSPYRLRDTVEVISSDSRRMHAEVSRTARREKFTSREGQSGLTLLALSLAVILSVPIGSLIQLGALGAFAIVVGLKWRRL